MLKDVSIVMAAYNEEKYIGEAIKSIICQSHKDWELIIVDDGSTDETVKIIEDFMILDARVNIIRNYRNRGLPFCLNKGIKASRFTFIARADADDINLPRRIELQIDFLRENPEVDVVGTGAWLLDENRARAGVRCLAANHEELAALPFKSIHFFHPSVMMRRRFIENVGLYDLKYTKAQDKELWLRGLRHGSVYANIQEPLIEYFTNGYVLSWKAIKEYAVCLFAIGRRYKIKNYFVYIILYTINNILVKARLKRPKSIVNNASLFSN
jgi:glycosyltransferase involved in cell wall biosynthesis